ncbi:MAG: GNAT family N-acetyltransferase [Myxococcota bacterium]
MHAWDRDPTKRRGVRGRHNIATVSLRNAEIRDDAALLKLWRELMDLHVELDPRFQLADSADQAFLSYAEAARTRDDYRIRVAETKGQVVGFAVSCILPNSPVYKTRWIGYINDISVTSSQRGNGIGELLVEDAIWWLKKNGAESIEVYVARLNAGAQKFWRRMGGRDYLDRMSIDLRGEDE